MAMEKQTPLTKLEQCDKVVKYGDFLSLIVFTIVWYTHDIYIATAALMAVIVPISLVAFVWYRAFPKMQVFMVGLVIIFGALTLIFQDPAFIKIKPTIMLIGMGLAAFASVWLGKPAFLAMLPKQHFSSSGMSEEALKPIMSTVTMRFGYMFVLLGVLNEIVWRTQTEEFWLWFKVFGSMGVSMLFIVLHYPWLKKEMKKLQEAQIAAARQKVENKMYQKSILKFAATPKEED